MLTIVSIMEGSMAKYLYVQNQPRGRRQAKASEKALAIRSENPHGRVVKKETEVSTLRGKDHSQCRLGEPVITHTRLGIEVSTYDFTHMETLWGIQRVRIEPPKKGVWRG